VTPGESGTVPESTENSQTIGTESPAAPDPARSIADAIWLILVAGLLAGLIAFAVGEQIYGLIPPALVQKNVSGNLVMMPDRTTWIVADVRNGALAFGLLGLCLGGCLGIAGGLTRQRWAAAATAGVLGAVLGTFVGAGLSLALLAWFLDARYTYPDYDVLVSLGMHSLIWGLLGAVAGLALALGAGPSRLMGRAVLAGWLGAVSGTAAYELSGAVFFAEAHTDYAISESWPTRLLARLLVSLGTAGALVLLLRSNTQGVRTRHPTAQHGPA
jgi:hypothetical protein